MTEFQGLQQGFTARVAGALKLSPPTYEDIEHDPGAFVQAIMVVAASSLATGIGSVRPHSISPLLSGAVFALAGWFVWALLVYWIGTRLLSQPQTHADVGQVLRTTGFAAAPGLFGIVGLVPLAGPLLFFGVSVWMLLAMLVAVRQALDFTNLWRALGVVVIGWMVYLMIIALAAVLMRI